MAPFYLKMLTVAAALGVFVLGKVCFHLKDDNPVEEMAEIVIKQETGMDIDLTPESIERIDNKNSQSKL